MEFFRWLSSFVFYYFVPKARHSNWRALISTVYICSKTKDFLFVFRIVKSIFKQIKKTSISTTLWVSVRLRETQQKLLLYCCYFTMITYPFGFENSPRHCLVDANIIIFFRNWIENKIFPLQSNFVQCSRGLLFFNIFVQILV